MEARVVATADLGHFEIRVDGEGIEPGKFPLRDLPRLGKLIQEGVERTARVLSGEPGGAPGPLPRTIGEVTRLLLTGIREGSATLALELPPPRDEEAESEDTDRLFPLPVRELGFRAMERWVSGLHELEEAAIGVIPADWDNSVMDTAEELAGFAAERGFTITLEAEPPRGHQTTARITPEALPRFQRRHSRIERRRSARGRLIAVDLGRGRIDIEEANRRRVECEFPDGMLEAVKRLIGEQVDVSGDEEYDPATSRTQRLQLSYLQPAAEAVPLHELFWQNKALEDVARDQGVEPLRSISDLAAPDLFTDEDIQRFIAAVRDARREE